MFFIHQWSLKVIRISRLAMAAVAALSLISNATAHARLLTTSPAADAAVTSPSELTLVFSETLSADFSGVELAMLTMPGMTMDQPMVIEGIAVAVGTDGKTLVATPAEPLGAGRYKLNWHVVTTDTHRIEGVLEFEVK